MIQQTPENLIDVDERIIKAVSSLSRQPRLTIPDVAALSGLDLENTRDQLVTLASLTHAAIDVTDQGILAYRFPPNVRAILRSRSLRANIRMLWDRAFPLLFTAVRISFGALLILSIVVTFIAIAALASASRSDDDRRDSRSSSFFSPRMFAPDIFDVMWYTRRSSYYAQSPRASSSSEMSFLESVYSLVFGDGDPNEDLEQRRWRRIAAVIRENNAAVTAEQLAPFLDLPPSFRADSNVVDESYVLPALQRFQGHPEVTESGDIIYVFPSLSSTGSRVPRIESAGSSAGPVLLENELTLSRASATQRALVVALGVVNIAAVLTLGVKLTAFSGPLSGDLAALVSLIRSIYPALATYAASFVIIPLARLLRQYRVNADIRARNDARKNAAVSLARPDSGLRGKLKAASHYSQRVDVVKPEDVVYSSDLDLLDQKSVQDNLTDDFDRRLKG